MWGGVTPDLFRRVFLYLIAVQEKPPRRWSASLEKLSHPTLIVLSQASSLLSDVWYWTWEWNARRKDQWKNWKKGGLRSACLSYSALRRTHRRWVFTSDRRDCPEDGEICERKLPDWVGQQGKVEWWFCVGGGICGAGSLCIGKIYDKQFHSCV